MTKQATIQTSTCLCTSLAGRKKKKSLQNLKTKTGVETSIKQMWWHIKPYTKQRCSVIHFLLFYFSSRVFTRHRHKDEEARSSPRQCVDSRGHWVYSFVGAWQVFILPFHDCVTISGEPINKYSVFPELEPSSRLSLARNTRTLNLPAPCGQLSWNTPTC